MSMSRMSSFSLVSTLLFFASISVLNQSHGFEHLERFLDYELKDSLLCYRSYTLNLFKNLKQVVGEYCIKYGEKEFRYNIKVRSSDLTPITKNGSNNELFLMGKKQAEDIGSKTIDKIQRCLSYSCSIQKQEEVDKFIRIFRKGCVECGDAEYLSSAIKRLERTCNPITEKNERISSNVKSLFADNSSNSYGMTDRWAKK